VLALTDLQLQILEAEHVLKKSHMTAVPFPEPRPTRDIKYSVAYEKPENINVVGSFILKTAIKRTEPFVIDLAVTMPTVRTLTVSVVQG